MQVSPSLCLFSFCGMFVLICLFALLLLLYVHMYICMFTFHMYILCTAVVLLGNFLYAGWVGCFFEVKGPLPRPVTHRIEVDSHDKLSWRLTRKSCCGIPHPDEVLMGNSRVLHVYAIRPVVAIEDC